MILAYFDFRPFLFATGLPVSVLLTLLVAWLAKAKMKKWKLALCTSIGFTTLFAFFFYGPFIGQTQIREFKMTWVIKNDPSNRIVESEVVMYYLDYPNHFIGEYSDELACHLREHGEEVVNVVFEVTSDYGRVRGFHWIEIAGLRGWQSENGYAGVEGAPRESPWD